MNTHITAVKILILACSIALLSSCYTTKGAFQGAGEDTRAAANALQLNN